MLTWNEYFFAMCDVAAMRSKDPSTKVGCVIIGPDMGTRATGYNGFPRGVLDLEERYNDRAIKYLLVEHAERNAMHQCAKVGVPLEGCILYVNNLPPCIECAKAIIQVGIREVNCMVNDIEKFKRWKPNWLLTKTILREAGVHVINHGCVEI